MLLRPGSRLEQPNLKRTLPVISWETKRVAKAMTGNWRGMVGESGKAVEQPAANFFLGLVQQGSVLMQRAAEEWQGQQLAVALQVSVHEGDEGERKRREKEQQRRREKTIGGGAQRDFAECGNGQRSPERFLPRLFATLFFTSLDAIATMPKPARKSRRFELSLVSSALSYWWRTTTTSLPGSEELIADPDL